MILWNLEHMDKRKKQIQKLSMIRLFNMKVRVAITIQQTQEAMLMSGVQWWSWWQLDTRAWKKKSKIKWWNRNKSMGKYWSNRGMRKWWKRWRMKHWRNMSMTWLWKKRKYRNNWMHSLSQKLNHIKST
jgi:hypothetical protein